MAQVNVQAFSGDVEISSDLAVDGDTLVVNATSDRVGINKAVPAYTLDVVGDINFSGDLYEGGNPFAGSPWAVSGDHLTYTTGNVAVGTSSTTNTSQAKHTVQGISRITNGTQNVDLSVGVDPIFGDYTHQAELLHPTPAAYDHFGYSVSISRDGNYALVGARWDDEPGKANCGTALVYFWNGTSWGYQDTLLHPTSAAQDNFGDSVSISGDGKYALVGCHYDDSDGTSSGSAQVYVRDGTSWDHQQELIHPNPAAYDNFGFDVSISADGNYALIGAYLDDPVAGASGSAQVYVRGGTSWTHQKELTHPNPVANDQFGHSVSISGDGKYALVGCPYDDTTGGGNAGSAQVYARDGTSWDHQKELLHPIPAANDSFGFDVSISADGNYALIGVPGLSPTASAQVYARGLRDGAPWTHQAELLHPNYSGVMDKFASTVSISGDGKYALIGVAFDDHNGIQNNGSAQVYVRDGTSWTHHAELLHPNPAAVDNFGWSVSISGHGTARCIVGSPTDDTTGGGTDAGSAQVYAQSTNGFNSELIVSSGIRADGTLLSFTGQHICFPEGRMSQGLVVSANQNKYMSLNGPVTMGLGAIKSSESLPVVSLSNVVNDRSVFGVVDRFEGGGVERTQTIGIGRVSSAKEFGDNRVIVNSIGEGALWVANTNGNLVSGDYLTTSSLPGYAQKQDSDSLRNSTVAKITMDCDFSPEDLPVQIIKKKENGDNDLDPYGRFQWVDSEETQKVYKVRYLDVSGSQTDQSNAAHIAAYVGCTYHCG